MNREAAIRNLQLQLGLTTERKVERWVEAQSPEGELSLENVEQRLRRMHAGMALCDVMPFVLGSAATRLADDRRLARRVATIAYNVWVAEGNAGSDELNELGYIQDALQEAGSGYGDSVSSVIQEFVDFASSLRNTN